MKRIFLIMALALASCAPKNPLAFDGVSSNYPEATPRIVADAAERVAGVYPPGQTTLYVDTHSKFGEELENALRKRGFTVSPSGMRVGYKLDILKGETPPSCYLSLHLPDGALTQTYALQGGSVIADSSYAKTGIGSTFNEYKAPVPLHEEDRFDSSQTLPSASLKPLPQTSAVASATPTTTPVVQAALSELHQPVPLASGWHLSPGMLRTQLEQWGAAAGYQIIWKSQNDFDMQASAGFNGDFVTAVQDLFTHMHSQGNPLRVAIYQDNRVVEILED